MTSVLTQFNREIASLIGARRRPAKPDLSDEQRQDRSAMTKARRLVAKNPAIDIDREGRGAWWVTVPGINSASADPCEGGHFCADGREVLQVVETYVAWLATPAGALAILPVHPAPGQPTVKRADLAAIRMTTGGEKRHPMVILDGTVRHWVGFAWVDEGAPSEEQARTLPLVVG